MLQIVALRCQSEETFCISVAGGCAVVGAIQIPRGPAEAVAFFVRQSGPLSRTADMPESSAGNTDRQELMSLRRPPGWISV